MAFDTIKRLIGDDKQSQPDVDLNDEYYEDTFKQAAVGGSKMILLEPRAFSEAQTIADYLKARNTVVVNLKRVTPDGAKRIVDFLSGAVYAIGGDLQKLGNGIFLCTPSNVNVEGKMSDGDKTQKKEKKQEEEFDW